MTFDSLTKNDKHDIPSQIFKTIFGLHASDFFRPQYVWFPNSSGQLTELIVYIIQPE